MLTVGRLRGSIIAAALVIALAGCGSGPSASPAASQPDQATGDVGGSGQVIFNVQVDFTGDDNVQGSFVDNDTGTGYASCTEYATFNPTGVGSWLSPGPPAGADTQIGGKSLTFAFMVSTADFHGPATYADSLGSLVIGDDTFVRGTTGTSTVTLNADGSGQGSFSELSDIGAQSGTESGTISWTCSG